MTRPARTRRYALRNPTIGWRWNVRPADHVHFLIHHRLHQICQPILIGHAVGVQIYSCNGTAWSFVAPRANLFDDHGKLIITHFGGPTWQAKDGSTVVGHAEASVTVDPTAIPWVLLSRASTAAGPDGDRLVDTTYIQRISTTGGLAPPAAECTAATAGTVAEVPYTADYYFWK